MIQYMIWMFLILAFLMLVVLFVEHELCKKESEDLNEKNAAGIDSDAIGSYK